MKKAAIIFISIGIFFLGDYDVSAATEVNEGTIVKPGEEIYIGEEEYSYFSSIVYKESIIWSEKLNDDLTYIIKKARYSPTTAWKVTFNDYHSAIILEPVLNNSQIDPLDNRVKMNETTSFTTSVKGNATALECEWWHRICTTNDLSFTMGEAASYNEMNLNATKMNNITNEYNVVNRLKPGAFIKIDLDHINLSNSILEFEYKGESGINVNDSFFLLGKTEEYKKAKFDLSNINSDQWLSIGNATNDENELYIKNLVIRTCEEKSLNIKGETLNISKESHPEYFVDGSIFFAKVTATIDGEVVNYQTSPATLFVDDSNNNNSDNTNSIVNPKTSSASYIMIGILIITILATLLTIVYRKRNIKTKE